MSEIQNPIVGQRTISDGSEHRPRGARTGELMMSAMQAVYYEQASRGNTWTISTPVAGITATTLMVVSTASAIPIVGVYNPSGSGRNIAIHRVIAMFTTGTVVNFVWGQSAAPGAQAAASTSAQVNNLTFATGGGIARVFNGSQAMVGTAAFFRSWPAALVEGATAAGQTTNSNEDRVDGEFLVAPGNFAGLFCTVATTAGVVRATLVYSEVTA